MTSPSTDRIALFPGSFDPFTIGHMSLVSRALPLFDKIVIAVGENSGKKSESTAESRVKAIEKIFEQEPKINVILYDGLTVDACRRVDARWMLRGVRSSSDFEYEKNLADINRQISGIETVLLYTLPEFASISSSMVRELSRFGYDVDRFLP